MKAVARLGKTLGGLVLLLMTMAWIVCVSLFVVGAYLTTWPILRQSPRTQRKQAIVNVLVSVFALAQVFGPDDREALADALGANKAEPGAETDA